GDNFATLAQGTTPRDSGRIDLQAFVDYLAAFDAVSPDLAQRAVGVHVVEPPADGYQPGDEVTVQLSSLLFSAGEQQRDQVTISVAGTEVGTFAIDPTIVGATDEVGRAAATFTIPEGTEAGELEVTLAVEQTGTTATFDVQVA